MTHVQWLTNTRKKYSNGIHLWQTYWFQYWQFPESKENDYKYDFLIGMAMSK